MASVGSVSPDTMISVKVLFEGDTRRFRIALRDLIANTLPAKLRVLLSIPAGKNVVFERFSDSNGCYIVLDTADAAVWKQLWRAAKAKLKLRLKVTAVPAPEVEEVKEEQPKKPYYTMPPLPQNPVQGEAEGPAARAASMAPPPAPPKQQQDVIKALIDHQKKHERIQQDSADWTAKLQTQKAHIDYQMQLQILEMQNRRRVEGCAGSRPEPTGPSLTSLMTNQEPVSEAPVPRAFHDAPEPDESVSSHRPNVLRGCDQTFTAPLHTFTVQCNCCDENITDAHWHCSICEEGDYDLCPSCVDFGMHCQVDRHFLIKRSIQDGRVVNSQVETAPRKATKSVTIEEPEKEIPGAFTESKDEALPESLEITRTCNSCVNSFDEASFVTCTVCEDYDLCIECHVGLKHGHDPSHKLEPVSTFFAQDHNVSRLCAPGRDVRHFASCDGCDKTIHGVRHKCLTCPDFDYCRTCYQSAPHIHPGHRFVPLYDTIAFPSARSVTHHSIRCDGPLCERKMSFIRGDRYKCAVCDDVDFCAACEALPTNPHNRTHPLVKFRTPVRHVSVATYGEGERGETLVTMGDRISTRSQSTETTPAAPSANAATQVQTVAEVKPTDSIRDKSKHKRTKTPHEAKPAKEEPEVVQETPESGPEAKDLFDAHYVQDTIADGTTMVPGYTRVQTWTLRNPGPATWPAGCCVRYVGGDPMLNIDNTRPSSITELDRAIQSNTFDTPVAPGAHVRFSVTIKAPLREGKAISYWRTRLPDGGLFGHKLWCDVNVQALPTSVTAVEAPAVEEESKVSKEEPKEDTKAVHESQMVFPTLDKESPVSSAHEAAPAAATVPAIAPSACDELEEDLESLGIDDDGTDDCCLTDEEYEIIDDAESSEEAINGKK